MDGPYRNTNGPHKLVRQYSPQQGEHTQTMATNKCWQANAMWDLFSFCLQLFKHSKHAIYCNLLNNYTLSTNQTNNHDFK